MFLPIMLQKPVTSVLFLHVQYVLLVKIWVGSKYIKTPNTKTGLLTVTVVYLGFHLIYYNISLLNSI